MSANNWGKWQPAQRSKAIPRTPKEPAIEVQPLTPAEVAALQRARLAEEKASGARLRQQLIASGQLKEASPQKLAELEERQRQRETPAFRSGARTNAPN